MHTQVFINFFLFQHLCRQWEQHKWNQENKEYVQTYVQNKFWILDYSLGQPIPLGFLLSEAEDVEYNLTYIIHPHCPYSGLNSKEWQKQQI